MPSAVSLVMAHGGPPPRGSPAGEEIQWGVGWDVVFVCMRRTYHILMRAKLL